MFKLINLCRKGLKRSNPRTIEFCEKKYYQTLAACSP